MKIHPRCYPCQIKRVMSELRLCNLPREQELEIARKMLLYYAKQTERRSSWLGTGARLELERLTGVKDPYAELKHRANVFALKQVPTIKKHLEAIGDPKTRFIRAALISVIGNLMEFFLMEHSFDLKFPKPLEELLNEERFSKDSIQILERSYEILHSAKKVLFLPDNAGEIVFDKIFIEELLRQFPSIEIYVALKPEPILNDATLRDAREIELDKVKNVKLMTTGVRSIGLFLQDASPSFKEIWHSSDMIILKGMGHIETRDELGEPVCAPTLYLLRVKCSTVSEMVNAKIGTNLAILDMPD